MATPPDSIKVRRSGLLRFGAGMLLAIVLGCMLAAVDLWGGVKTLGISPRTLGLAFVAVPALLVSGAWRWLISWPYEERLRRGIWAVAVLAALAAVVGGVLFAYYASRLRTSEEICARAQCALTSAERDALLDEGLGPLFPTIDPGYDCIDLEQQRRKLRAQGECPSILLDDRPCRCGRERWSAGHPDRCTTGRTSCEYRSGEYVIGCAGEYLTKKLARCAP